VEEEACVFQGKKKTLNFFLCFFKLLRGDTKVRLSLAIRPQGKLLEVQVLAGLSYLFNSYFFTLFIASAFFFFFQGKKKKTDA
jgi:hypothetical protein